MKDGMFPTIVFILLTRSNTVFTPCTSICSLVWTELKTYSIPPLQDQYPVWRTKNITVSVTIYQVWYNWMPVEIYIIHCKKEWPPWLIGIHPITELCQVTEESIQVSPPFRLAPVEGERLTCLLVAWYCHTQTHTTLPFLYLTLALHRFSLVTLPNFLFCVSNL